MIYSETDKLVVVDGVSDYIIVDKEDTLLIFPKSKEQDIKKLVQDIKARFGDKYN
jgi:mannose-1-phosphate guanylyltransferase